MSIKKNKKTIKINKRIELMAKDYNLPVPVERFIIIKKNKKNDNDKNKEQITINNIETNSINNTENNTNTNNSNFGSFSTNSTNNDSKCFKFCCCFNCRIFKIFVSFF
jgi:hypothetical protein